MPIARYFNISTATMEASLGAPWAVRLIYAGANAENKSGVSAKWYEVRCAGNGAMPRVAWGPLSRAALDSDFKPFTGARRVWDKLAEKMAKGYRYDPRTETVNIGERRAMVLDAAPSPPPAAARGTPSAAPTNPFAQSDDAFARRFKGR